MKWIKVVANLANKNVVFRAMQQLGVSKHEAMGLLVQFWCSASECSDNGNAGHLPDDQIEAWAGWPDASGHRPEASGRFAKFVREFHLDSDGRIRDWDDFQGELEAWRTHEAERKREARARLKAERAAPAEVSRKGPKARPNKALRSKTGEASGSCPEVVRTYVTGVPSPSKGIGQVRPDASAGHPGLGEVRCSTSSSSSSPALSERFKALGEQGWMAVEDFVGDIEAGKYGDVNAWIHRINGWLDGLNLAGGRAAEPADIAAALGDYALLPPEKRSYTALHVQAYINKAIEKRLAGVGQEVPGGARGDVRGAQDGRADRAVAVLAFSTKHDLARFAAGGPALHDEVKKAVESITDGAERSRMDSDLWKVRPWELTNLDARARLQEARRRLQEAR